MMAFWQQHELDWLRDRFANGAHYRDVHAEFCEKFRHVSIGGLTRKCKDNKIMPDQSHRWSQQEKDWVFAQFEHAEIPPIRVIWESFRLQFRDIELHAFASWCLKRGLRTGRDGRFETGHISHPDAGPKGPNGTSFKKGHKSVRTLPDGTRRSTRNTRIVEIKVDGEWYNELRYHYEQLNGPVPDGHYVTAMDGDRTNFAPENMVLLTVAEHTALNNYRRWITKHPEARPAMIALAKISQATKTTRNLCD